MTRGTGIATYTRMLTHAAHDLGHEIGVVYSTPFTPAKNPLLREIAFFDEKRPAMSGRRRLTLRRAINHAVDQTRYHLPVRPLPVELSGAVVARQFRQTLASHDRVFVARNLFANARNYFSADQGICQPRLRAAARHPALHLSAAAARQIGAECLYHSRSRAASAAVHDARQQAPALPASAKDRPGSRSHRHGFREFEARHHRASRRRGSPITNTYQTVEFPQEWVARPMAASRTSWMRTFGLGLHDFLLFYGALEPKKNVRRLIDAYLISGVDIPLVLVVGGGWQNDAEMQLLAGKAPASRRLGGSIASIM